MPEIRMDIDQAQDTISALDSSYQSFADQLNALSTSVQALQSAWKGNAQQQFVGVWEAWLSSTQTKLDELGPLRNGLITERDQIIEADQSSNFG